MSNAMRFDSSHDGKSVYVHPQYTAMQSGTFGGGSVDFRRGVWDTMIDTFYGERQVKSRGVDYLPKTSGMVAEAAINPTSAEAAYQSYLTRAQFPEIVNQIVTDMCGMIFSADPAIELSGRLEEMREYATASGMTMNCVAREVVSAQLTTGRIGLLLDPQDGTGIVAPTIAMYNEKSILNWGEDDEKNLTFVILDESKYVCDKASGLYSWKESYRVCNIDSESGLYYNYVTDSAKIDLSTVPPEAYFPEIAGNGIAFIPFVIINSYDISNDCSLPAMLPVANIALAAYRNSADYELALYMTAQATTVITGADAGENIALGSNRCLKVKNPDAKVYFHEISGAGIDKQRQAIADKIAEANKFGIELAENSAESGTALNTRLTIKTASLTEIAKTCDAGMNKLLKMAAMWCGYSEDDVSFSINKDFRNDQITAQDISLLSNEISKGNFTKRDLHKLLLDGQWTKTEDFNEWLAEAESGSFSMPTASGIGYLNEEIEDQNSAGGADENEGEMS